MLGMMAMLAAVGKPGVTPEQNRAALAGKPSDLPFARLARNIEEGRGRSRRKRKTNQARGTNG